MGAAVAAIAAGAGAEAGSELPALGACSAGMSCSCERHDNTVKSGQVKHSVVVVDDCRTD